MSLVNFLKFAIGGVVLLFIISIATYIFDFHKLYLYGTFWLFMLIIIFFWLRRAFITTSIFDFAMVCVLIVVLTLMVSFYFTSIYEKQVDKSEQDALVMKEYYETTNASEPLDYILLNKNSKISFDLSRYAKDPDNDKLLYSYSGGENTLVTISGSAASVVPDHDFYGIDHIRFMVNDGKTLVATNEITVIVLKATSSEQFLFDNKVMIATILVMLYILGAFVSIKEYRDEFAKFF